ncbi:MAG: arginine deiminase-related protein [Saprospiraceae bacterium]|nr:arginine deiminase-related protein [Saprospiraceae bacterium]
MAAQQITHTILMIRPASFGFNPETAESNAFQSNVLDHTPAEIKQLAQEEFDEMVKQLRSSGVEVIVVEDDDRIIKTDAVFPNNWVSFHQDGTVVTYPMLSSIRRHERREDIIALLAKDFVVSKRIHLEYGEGEGRFLEGTGSLILDRQHKKAYACLSPRTDPALLDDFCRQMDYSPVVFTALDPNGQKIYHTNVMMNIGETFAVVCLDSIADGAERAAVVASLEADGKEVIAISFPQMLAFAGNMLQVREKSGDPLLVMSKTAYDCLTPNQLEQLSHHCQLRWYAIPTIEKYGGGSARCMMAEVFLPKRG